MLELKFCRILSFALFLHHFGVSLLEFRKGCRSVQKGLTERISGDMRVRIKEKRIAGRIV